MSHKTALITGVTGQDGAYLSEFLLGKGYVVYGMQQLSATPNTQNIKAFIGQERFHLLPGDMTDANNITQILSQIKPDEIYNLAGQSHVGHSFHVPEYTAQVNGVGVLRLLEAMRILGLNARLYQASTSEIFGNCAVSPQNEESPMIPASPYAAAKLYAHNMMRVYRESYGLHASCGILFNHESPLRGEEFVTRKISQAVAAIYHGQQDCLELGNLDAQRDWGHAKDYVEGMWLMLQQDNPDDYVLATGKSYSVRYFVERAFMHVGISIQWQGFSENEVGVNSKTGQVLVKINPQFFRPNDIYHLIGDAQKARQTLGWQPKVDFESMVAELMDSDLKSYE